MYGSQNCYHTTEHGYFLKQNKYKLYTELINLLLQTASFEFSQAKLN